MGLFSFAIKTDPVELLFKWPVRFRDLAPWLLFDLDGATFCLAHSSCFVSHFYISTEGVFGYTVSSI